MLVVLLHESHLLSLVSWVWVECDPDAYLSLCEYLVLTTTTGIEGICPGVLRSPITGYVVVCECKVEVNYEHHVKISCSGSFHVLPVSVSNRAKSLLQIYV